MKGIITRIQESKTKGGKDYLKVWVGDRKNFTPVWDELKGKWPYIIVGQEVELKFIPDGKDDEGKDKFKMIDIIPSTSPQATPEPPHEVPQPYIKESREATKDETITRLACIKAAADFCSGGKDTVYLLNVASLMLHWVKGEIKDVTKV